MVPLLREVVVGGDEGLRTGSRDENSDGLLVVEFLRVRVGRYVIYWLMLHDHVISQHPGCSSAVRK
jgi:hypothetical protein